MQMLKLIDFIYQPPFMFNITNVNLLPTGLVQQQILSQRRRCVTVIDPENYISGQFISRIQIGRFFSYGAQNLAAIH